MFLFNIIVMGVDKRGVSRGKCNACKSPEICDEFVIGSTMVCEYCLHSPVQHDLLEPSPKRRKTSEEEKKDNCVIAEDNQDNTQGPAQEPAQEPAQDPAQEPDIIFLNVVTNESEETASATAADEIAEETSYSANCNRFTHNEVLHEWLTLDTLCESILDPVLGPGIGHASDGDTRRRKLMLNQAMSGNQHRYRPVSVELGFIMSARIELSPAGKRIVKDLYDQDSIHNDKKIINPLDHPTRVLRLGRYSAHMNHLRLVMTTFPPSIHGLRADDVSRKDRQKWEVVQRLKFLSVQKCLLDIVDGNNDATKHISVYGTWAFLYVAWHYTELFFSLHASLRERVKYAAFVVIFFSLWRNWVILTDGLTLKENFLTRECFQDVLLSCHFAVILISYFRDEYPDLECPLDLTGTDCCERYFSENGSFVKNRHNYTFLDMHTSLGYMNRLQVIKATNPDIKFPNRKHNNDFIWDKQFQQDQRKRVCDLRDYPSAGQVICAWEEGVVMAKDLARQLGMHPDDEREEGDDDDDDDDNKWFHKPMGHVDFKKSLQGMLTEDQQEVLRRNALGVDSEENGSCDDEEPPSCSSEAHVDEVKPPSLETVKPPPPSVNSETATSINSETISTPRSGFRYKKWYRFTGAAGSAMSTKCVPGRHCGSHAPGWLSGSHPTQAEGMVTRKVCFTWGNNCCRWNNSIRVRNCGEFYVYELGKTPLCNLRYCGNGGSGR
ncbi:hypothetical protein QZH41_006891 [Actinostola sp. cb2023]|nr:hypothetical protein QZH41_006891 [Actinostola sp. cb2023]